MGLDTKHPAFRTRPTLSLRMRPSRPCQQALCVPLPHTRPPDSHMTTPSRPRILLQLIFFFPIRALSVVLVAPADGEGADDAGIVCFARYPRARPLAQHRHGPRKASRVFPMACGRACAESFTIPLDAGALLTPKMPTYRYSPLIIYTHPQMVRRALVTCFRNNH